MNELDDVDEEFLSQIEEAETKALINQKRKRFINQEEANKRNSGISKDACFQCGKVGHWSRDCDNNNNNINNNVLGYGGNEGFSTPTKTTLDDDDKACPCGLGLCVVYTANTERNRGRKFYRCPAREENGGCGFFEWCDSSSATPTSNDAQYSTPSSSFPDVTCPCGAGVCLIRTAKTEKNMGQQFYRCPANQESSCGFFQWCSERSSTGALQTNTFKTSNLSSSSNKSYGESRGNSCFKCGQDGHWARDCPEPSSGSSVDFGGNSASSGTCYKCGMSGHWARDCPKPSSASSVEVAGRSVSAGSCYKCGKSGHWAKDCPGQDPKAGRWR